MDKVGEPRSRGMAFEKCYPRSVAFSRVFVGVFDISLSFHHSQSPSL